MYYLGDSEDEPCSTGPFGCLPTSTPGRAPPRLPDIITWFTDVKRAVVQQTVEKVSGKSKKLRLTQLSPSHTSRDVSP